MAVVADRRWHRKIDAHHTHRDLGNETLGRISIAREDRNRLAFVMDVRVAQAASTLNAPLRAGQVSRMNVVEQSWADYPSTELVQNGRNVIIVTFGGRPE